MRIGGGCRQGAGQGSTPEPRPSSDLTVQAEKKIRLEILEVDNSAVREHSSAAGTAESRRTREHARGPGTITHAAQTGEGNCWSCRGGAASRATLREISSHVKKVQEV